MKARGLLLSPSMIAASLVLLAVVMSAVAASLLAPYDPLAQDLLSRRQPPTLQHLLGTDNYGRDILSRLIYGARTSLQVGLMSVLIGLCLGASIGLVAGYYGGITDEVIMRCMDVLLAFPSLILAMVVIVALGRNLLNAMLAIGVWFAPNYARIARGTALALREEAYVEAARAMGCTNCRILRRHILPNALTDIIVYSTLNIGVAFLMEAALSFLGLGIQPPAPSWGAMINDGRGFLQIAPHIVTVPGVAITLTVLALNTVGERIRVMLDPKAYRTGRPHRRDR